MRSTACMHVAAVVLMISVASSHAGFVTYSFEGAITRLNQGSDIFPDIQVGDPVAGTFTVDYGAPDIYPSATYGVYHSVAPITGNINGNVFATTSSQASFLSVELRLGVAHWVNFKTIPDDLSTIRFVNLTFYDPTGSTISSDSIPASAAVFESFPTKNLYLEGPDTFGSYRFDATITQIPEPSTALLLLLGMVSLMGMKRRIRASTI